MRKLCQRTPATWAELREASAAVINNHLLIDLGPDITAASQTHACSLCNVRYCLQTHAHAEQLDLSHLLLGVPATV